VRRDNGEAIAAYAAGSPDGDIDAIDRAVRAAAQAHPGLPTLAYWPAAAQLGRVPVSDIVGVEAYWRAS
jgi:hypothetical protein